MELTEQNKKEKLLFIEKAIYLDNKNGLINDFIMKDWELILDHINYLESNLKLNKEIISEMCINNNINKTISLLNRENIELLDQLNKLNQEREKLHSENLIKQKLINEFTSSEANLKQELDINITELKRQLNVKEYHIQYLLDKIIIARELLGKHLSKDPSIKDFYRELLDEVPKTNITNIVVENKELKQANSDLILKLEKLQNMKCYHEESINKSPSDNETNSKTKGENKLSKDKSEINQNVRQKCESMLNFLDKSKKIINFFICNNEKLYEIVQHCFSENIHNSEKSKPDSIFQKFYEEIINLIASSKAMINKIKDAWANEQKYINENLEKNVGKVNSYLYDMKYSINDISSIPFEESVSKNICVSVLE